MTIRLLWQDKSAFAVLRVLDSSENKQITEMKAVVVARYSETELNYI